MLLNRIQYTVSEGKSNIREMELYVKKTKFPNVVRPTLLYISSEAVIPAKAGIQFRNTGFRVKPGMTKK